MSKSYFDVKKHGAFAGEIVVHAPDALSIHEVQFVIKRDQAIKLADAINLYIKTIDAPSEFSNLLLKGDYVVTTILVNTGGLQYQVAAGDLQDLSFSLEENQLVNIGRLVLQLEDKKGLLGRTMGDSIGLRTDTLSEAQARAIFVANYPSLTIGTNVDSPLLKEPQTLRLERVQ